MTRKKSALETLDALLVSDFVEVKRGLEKADRMLASDVEEIRKKWGHPILYDDDFHRKERERLRRLRLER